MKSEHANEPTGVDRTTQIKHKLSLAIVPDMKVSEGKCMRSGGSQDVKDRQSSKLKELSDTLIAAGFGSLDEQATALGLSRSTTWTILKARHKNYGLSGALINRILQRPGLPRPVRAKLIEYVQEKASGFYGHNKIQLRRFRERLSIRAATVTRCRKKLTEFKVTVKRANPGHKRRDWSTRASQ
jgi:hypothetical protein